MAQNAPASVPGTNIRYLSAGKQVAGTGRSWSKPGDAARSAGGGERRIPFCFKHLKLQTGAGLACNFQCKQNIPKSW
eukprot:1732257-Rhodomonas_salina.3